MTPVQVNADLLPADITVFQRGGVKPTPQAQAVYEAIRVFDPQVGFEIKESVGDSLKNPWLAIPEGVVVVVVGVKP